MLLATIVSLVGSLLADYLLVKLGTHVFPSTAGYTHFQFSDYSKLTVIGVLIACAAWPIATRLTSTPREFFFRAAIVITIVLFAPDLWIWHGGSPLKAVFVLDLAARGDRHRHVQRPRSPRASAARATHSSRPLAGPRSSAALRKSPNRSRFSRVLANI